MSYVTSVILSCSDGDCRDVTDLGPPLGPGLIHMAAYCEGNPGIGRLPAPANSIAAGDKGMEADVYCFGVNYFDQEEFMDAVAAAPWQLPYFVQVFIRGEEDEQFIVYNLQRDRTWVKLSPPGTGGATP